jgi:hypothetical protein
VGYGSAQRDAAVGLENQQKAMPDNTTSGKRFEFLPLSIRIATLGGIATPLVLRGTPLPTKRSDVFSTVEENQASIQVELLIGERPLTRDNVPLGSFMLHGIPPASRGAPQVTVDFSVDAACAVTARAALRGSDITAEQTLVPPLDLSPDAVARVLADAETAREADGLSLRLVEASNRARSLIHRAEERLKAGPNKEINEAIAALGLALAANNADAIREQSDSIESLISGPSTVPDFSDLFRQFFAPPPRTASPRPSPPRQQPQKRIVPPKEALVVSPHAPVLGKIFGGSTFTLDPQLCFVIMPFSERLQPIYEDSIKPTIEAAGLRCERADDVRGTTLITWDIWERINRARFLVADLTDLNPNVFYELGLAHALSKEVVLITQSMKFVPFNLKALRCICYDLTRRGTQQLEEKLAATIATLMKVQRTG